MAQLTGDCPERLLLVGVQPEQLEDFGGSLRPCVRAALAPGIAAALDYLAGFGIAPLETVTAETTGGSPPEASDPLGLGRYETERPGPDQACRTGDARFLNTAPSLPVRGSA